MPICTELMWTKIVNSSDAKRQHIGDRPITEHKNAKHTHHSNNHSLDTKCAIIFYRDLQRLYTVYIGMKNHTILGQLKMQDVKKQEMLNTKLWHETYLL